MTQRQMHSQIETKQLYTKIDRLEQQVRVLQSAEKVNSSLFDILNAVNTTPDLDDLYVSIHQSLNRLIPVSNMFISLYDRKNSLLHFPYFIDEKDDQNYGETIVFREKSLTAEVILKKMLFFWIKRH